jgi:hypothetical protein
MEERVLRASKQESEMAMRNGLEEEDEEMSYSEKAGVGAI